MSHIFRFSGEALLLARLAKAESIAKTAARTGLDIADLARLEAGAEFPPHRELLLLLDIHRLRFEDFIHLMAALSCLDDLARQRGRDAGISDVFRRYLVVKEIRGGTSAGSTSTSPRQLGAVLTMFRTLRRMSPEELAERAEIEPEVIERYESGRALPEEAELLRLLEILGVNATGLREGLALARTLSVLVPRA